MKVLPTAIGRSPPSGFLAQLVSHQVRPKFERYFSFENHIHKICYGCEKIQSSLAVRLGSQIFQNLGRNAIQPCTRAVGEGYESLVDEKFRG